MQVNFQNESLLQKSTSLPKNHNKFIQALFRLLEDNEYPTIVTWANEGTSVRILKPTEFQENVLPKVYSHIKLTSFIRQLNMYNFKRGKKSPDGAITYSHPFFKRGRADLLPKVERFNPRKRVSTQKMENIRFDDYQSDNSTLNLDFTYLDQDVQIFNETQHVTLETDYNNSDNENLRLWKTMIKDYLNEDQEELENEDKFDSEFGLLSSISPSTSCSSYSPAPTKKVKKEDDEYYTVTGFYSGDVNYDNFFQNELFDRGTQMKFSMTDYTKCQNLINKLVQYNY